MIEYAHHPLREVQVDVAEFEEEVCDRPWPKGGPAVREHRLRADLIREEAGETVDAILRGDLVEAVDGLCDLIWVCLGAAHTFGVDLALAFQEVSDSNHAKKGGPIRADGKRLKPEGWQPPDVAGALRVQGWLP